MELTETIEFKITVSSSAKYSQIENIKGESKINGKLVTNNLMKD